MTVFAVQRVHVVTGFSFLAQRERTDAVPQTAECTDSTGLPETPAGTIFNNVFCSKRCTVIPGYP